MNAKPPPLIVLVLCHETPAANALVRLLRDWGYEAVRGCEPNEVAEQLRPQPQPIHAIIADGPGLEGVKLVSQLAARGFVAKVLLVTDDLRGPGRWTAIRGGYRVMDKPISPERLRAWLEAD